jgi:hypothetical protein
MMTYHGVKDENDPFTKVIRELDLFECTLLDGGTGESTFVQRMPSEDQEEGHTEQASESERTTL